MYISDVLPVVNETRANLFCRGETKCICVASREETDVTPAPRFIMTGRESLRSIPSRDGQMITFSFCQAQPQVETPSNRKGRDQVDTGLG